MPVDWTDTEAEWKEWKQCEKQEFISDPFIYPLITTTSVSSFS